LWDGISNPISFDSGKDLSARHRERTKVGEKFEGEGDAFARGMLKQFHRHERDFLLSQERDIAVDQTIREKGGILFEGGGNSVEE